MHDPHPAIGPIWHPEQVAALVQDHLQAWSETYLAALGIQTHGNKDTYRPVATWGQVPDQDPQPGYRRGHVAPAILVAPDGVRQTDGGIDGDLAGSIAIGVLIYTVGSTRETALNLASTYMAMVYAIVTQQQYLPAIPGALITWSRASLTDRPTGQQVTEGWAMVELTVTVPVLVNGGQLTQPATGRDLPELPTVDTVRTQITTY